VRRALALLAVASFALGGCADQIGHVNSAGSTALTIGKATGAADSTYIAAYNAGVAAVKAGTLKREDFLTWEAVAYDAVLLVRAAKTIADLATAQAQLASAAAQLGYTPSN
jgi:hypothetical protein